MGGGIERGVAMKRGVGTGLTISDRRSKIEDRASCFTRNGAGRMTEGLSL